VLERPARAADDLGELQEQLDERQLGRLDERARVDVGRARDRDPLPAA